MTKAPSPVLLVVALVIGIGATITLNNMSQKLTPKSDEQLEAEAAQAQKDAAAKNPAPAAKQAPDTSPTNMLAALGPDVTQGASSPTAPAVTIRWSWTPEVQSDPGLVSRTIEGITKEFPQVRLHIVNTDETPGVPDGVLVGDKMIAPAAPTGEIKIAPATVKSAIGQ